MSIIIKNGKIINADNSLIADVLITGEKILTIEKDILPGNDDKVIDATGRYIFPGGIDPHVHLNLKTASGFSNDDFLSGSKAALNGGTTSIIDFVTPEKNESLLEALHKRKNEASNCLIDHKFHVSPVKWDENTAEEIKACIQAGITSFKVYMAYKDSIGLNDEDLFKVLKTVGTVGGIVAIHCEMGDEIEALRNQYFTAGKIEPKYHPLSRPPHTEAKAVKKAIELAKKAKCPIYIVHVSSPLSLTHIRNAQSKGQTVYAETCPQYLLLNDSVYNQEFEKAAPFVMSPPLRKKEDNGALWNALADDTLQSIGTDHCPFKMVQKRFGKEDFRKIANGAGGIEHRLALLYTFGVLQKKIPLERFVALTSTNPAKIFGWFPRKGIIQEGSDADIVIWNPDHEETISVKTHHQNCDSNIYEGITIKGKAEVVIRKGTVINQSK
jgi:dihydropyrimidinase